MRPGPLQRQIRRAFLVKPGALLTTGDLIEWCYPRRDEPICIDQCRHVRRAAEAVAERVAVRRENMNRTTIWRAKPSQLLPKSKIPDD